MNKNVKSKKPTRKAWSVPHQTKAKVMRLLALGTSMRETARQTGLSQTTVTYMVDRKAYYRRGLEYRMKTREARLKQMREYYLKVVKPRNELNS